MLDVISTNLLDEIILALLRADAIRLIVHESGHKRPRKRLRLACDREAMLDPFVADHRYSNSCGVAAQSQATGSDLLTDMAAPPARTITTPRTMSRFVLPDTASAQQGIGTFRSNHRQKEGPPKGGPLCPSPWKKKASAGRVPDLPRCLARCLFFPL